MSVKTLAAMSAAILLASASLASAQQRTRAEPSAREILPLRQLVFQSRLLEERRAIYGSQRSGSNQGYGLRDALTLG
jgi:hypothetical protein